MDLDALVGEYGTPFYLYRMDRLNALIDTATNEASKYNFHLHYAIKANANPKVLEVVKRAGIGIDCVTGNEVQAAVNAGFSGGQIAFAGVGKTDHEIKLGLEHGIFSFNVESFEELQVIEEISAQTGQQAPIALRINPDVNANTHKYITTGLEENKFGINVSDLERVTAFIMASESLKLKGIHFHIGSQITDLSAFKNLCLKVNELQSWFEAKRIRLDHVNVGGGLGIDYEHPDEKLIPDFANYFRIFNEFLQLRPGQQVHFELGRALVANAGDLISKAVYVKKGIRTDFVILDAGMTELIRPALYQAYHKIENWTSTISETSKYDVVGPICESSDCFGKQVELPVTKRGDVLAIRCAGAYGEVMRSNYNLRPEIPAVFIDS